MDWTQPSKWNGGGGQQGTEQKEEEESACYLFLKVASIFISNLANSNNFPVNAIPSSSSSSLMAKAWIEFENQKEKDEKEKKGIKNNSK